MLTRLFASKPPLDEESVEWIFEVFAWALRNCGAEFFHNQTVLVNPTNEHFPGHADSVTAMAELIFRKTAQHAGMANWPLRLLEPGSPPPAIEPRIRIPDRLRAEAEPSHSAPHGAQAISIAYDPALIGNPEALIAGMAQNLAHYLGAAVGEAAPGGLQNWPQATEVLAVFMGFGLMFANTAFQFQTRSCGGCGGPSAQRQAFLSQHDITYALALFCLLKDISEREALRHLKKPLRPYFKRCVRDLATREENMARLRALG